MNKKIFSLHVDVDDFIPASEEEKAYMVKMRPSTTFFKDGMKRLMKNKIMSPIFNINSLTLRNYTIELFLELQQAIK